MKPTIRKAGDRWVLTRPGFGFATSDTVTLHESWQAARTALLGSAPAAAGASVERGHYTLTSPGQTGWPRRGTIRMEDT